MISLLKKLVYDNGNIVISEHKLYCYGENINFNLIESVSCSTLPRRSLFTGLKQWFIIFFILVIVCNIWRNLMLIGDIYVYSIFGLMAFNIFCFCQKYYLLTIRTISGKEYYTKGKDKYLIMEIVKEVNCKIEKVHMIDNKNIIVNNGIINKGNYNVNKIKEGKVR